MADTWAKTNMAPLRGWCRRGKHLWPEPRRTVEPTWNAERKDKLEWRLADLVCGGQLGLATAQKAIRDNWVDAYRTYIGER
jgi:hypothetical protein